MQIKNDIQTPKNQDASARNHASKPESVINFDTASKHSRISGMRSMSQRSYRSPGRIPLEKIKEAKKKTKIVPGHAMAIRDDRRGKQKDHKLYDGKITHKEFGEDDNEGHDAAQWKNRAKDWYNAERRFIFATKGPKTLNKWCE